MRAETDSDPKQSGSSEWISSLSKRLRERLTEESLLQGYKSVPRQGQVGTGGWFPRSTTTSNKVVFPPLLQCSKPGRRQ
ncbi:MAG: hypothetical protein E6J31_11315 [Chloroflexi bacterium]|nr:MAG: hypothetical protein E6J36_18665 [Chloroflexota bacterium]TMC38161.1 MAG: hypothetical protein E6J31_11315 [Chloroflexota bacterium]TMC85672.1 MAG: hypothetical protein E6J22_19815 [Chloroflexota bacterium]TMC93186.1 MAG: hypothetical protein E6J11_17830 [Chloroflexota bacterium]